MSPAADDAGKPLPEVPAEVFNMTVFGERPPKRVVFMLRVLPWIFAAAALWWAYRANWATFSFVSLLPAIAVALALRFVRSSTEGHGVSRVPPWVGWVAAHRRCGCCAYDLHTIEPDVTGLATCPECGAAWHRDRWTRAEKSLPDDMARRTSLWQSVEHTDDRGVCLDTAPRWPPSWATESRSEPAVRAIREFARHRRSMQVRWTLLLVTLAWPGFTWLMLSRADPLPREFNRELAFFAVVVGLIGGAVLWLAWRVGPSWQRQRELIVLKDLCPACGAALSGIEPGFDRCRVCRVCAHAWGTGDSAATGK